MRPTLMPGMQLASQKTPGPGDAPSMTYDGCKLGPTYESKNANGANKGVNWGREERFGQYKQWAKVTGKFNGP
jgi:hypothetical protein